ncbi:MAG: agmatine deiminase family protein, partial [Gammaproteobacteria bacterium]
LGARTFDVPYQDTWVRDFGPLTVSGNGFRLLDFRFDGWGKKHPYELDDQVTRRLHALGAFTCPLASIDWILEGGSIDTDGQGTLLTTPCLERRHPHLSRTAIEARLRTHLGAERVLWVEGWIPGDDTDGHIDTLARFCSPDTLAYIQAPHLRPMEEALRSFTDPRGHPYRLVPLPLPDIRDRQGRPLPASYANFLILNGAVIAPTYRHPLDAVAMERFREAFPGYDIVPIDAFPFIHQYGSIHCLTMTTPCA